MTPEEDAVLRRLTWFERFGAELAPSLRAVKSAIRARDKRAAIRDPQDVAFREQPGDKPVS